jgi:hypothetical protein
LGDGPLWPNQGGAEILQMSQWTAVGETALWLLSCRRQLLSQVDPQRWWAETPARWNVQQFRYELSPLHAVDADA